MEIEILEFKEFNSSSYFATIFFCSEVCFSTLALKLSKKPVLFSEFVKLDKSERINFDNSASLMIWSL